MGKLRIVLLLFCELHIWSSTALHTLSTIAQFNPSLALELIFVIQAVGVFFEVHE